MFYVWRYRVQGVVALGVLPLLVVYTSGLEISRDSLWVDNGWQSVPPVFFMSSRPWRILFFAFMLYIYCLLYVFVMWL